VPGFCASVFIFILFFFYSIFIKSKLLYMNPDEDKVYIKFV
jgi:hypothetical protein